ncbi:Phage protein [Sodalis praecaptivus]|uniref:Phage protein n=1 Tax=Sodalis praecaptivus TaxID=1239307 RepID=W0HVT9_9GAMM|nr:hypothetical protein [Sodalis praecaptivus]AHF77889.1 Phage protein [Sodalis praecaptivus]
MSIKNKVKDRMGDGKIRPLYTVYPGVKSREFVPYSRRPVNYGNSPGWWVNLFMNRPRRRKNKALCRAIMQGCRDYDGVAFPLGNSKPHVYYW